MSWGNCGLWLFSTFMTGTKFMGSRPTVSKIMAQAKPHTKLWWICLVGPDLNFIVMNDDCLFWKRENITSTKMLFFFFYLLLSSSTMTLCYKVQNKFYKNKFHNIYSFKLQSQQYHSHSGLPLTLYILYINHNFSTQQSWKKFFTLSYQE